MSAGAGLNYDDLLEAVPVRNAAVECKRADGGELRLILPLKRRWFHHPPVSWLLPISQQRTFGLDELGAEVWEACTGGRRTVEIIRQFAGEHQLSFHEARVSVCAFLRTLTDRKLLVMVGSPGTPGSPARGKVGGEVGR